VVLVEHDIEVVLSVCTAIVVLDFGNVLMTGQPETVIVDPRVSAAYLGQDESVEESVGGAPVGSQE
jgi:ABC-type branched-subunit amino acid transport system ATPase component